MRSTSIYRALKQIEAKNKLSYNLWRPFGPLGKNVDCRPNPEFEDAEQ